MGGSGGGSGNGLGAVPYGVRSAAVVTAAAAVATAIAATLVGSGAHAALVAAAAEQDEQDDDPQTVVAAEAIVVIHRITSGNWISERLHRSFHVIPGAGFGDRWAVAIAALGCYTIGNLRKKEQFHENLA